MTIELGRYKFLVEISEKSVSVTHTVAHILGKHTLAAADTAQGLLRNPRNALNAFSGV